MSIDDIERQEPGFRRVRWMQRQTQGFITERHWVDQEYMSGVYLFMRDGSIWFHGNSGQRPYEVLSDTQLPGEWDEVTK